MSWKIYVSWKGHDEKDHMNLVLSLPRYDDEADAIFTQVALAGLFDLEGLTVAAAVTWLNVTIQDILATATEKPESPHVTMTRLSVTADLQRLGFHLAYWPSTFTVAVA